MSEATSPANPGKKKSSILKKVLIVLLVAIAAIVGIIAAQPNEFRIVRSATMAAPQSEVFAQVNDFHHWNDWSPWAKLDPAAKNTFEGPESGKGAVFSWDGNDKVGSGRMTILESRPSELVQIKLEFFRPMEDESTTKFTFKPEGEKTQVTWDMSGRHTFMSKAFCMLMNMDKIVGGQFEEGLSNMKAIVEKPSRQD